MTNQRLEAKKNDRSESIYNVSTFSYQVRKIGCDASAGLIIQALGTLRDCMMLN
jgi:hypothetical protein